MTTHVLDMMMGKSGQRMWIDFSVLEGERYRLIKTFITNENGRTDEPMLSGNAIPVGRYEMMLGLTPRNFGAPKNPWEREPQIDSETRFLATRLRKSWMFYIADSRNRVSETDKSKLIPNFTSGRSLLA